MGRLGSFNPRRLRVMARVSRVMARSCAITFSESACFMPFKRTVSDSFMRSAGTPLIIDTTAAMASSSTTIRCSLSSFCQSSRNCLSSASPCNTRSRKPAASSYSCLAAASSFSFRSCWISCSFASMEAGTRTFSKCTRLPASSNASIALSGKARSLI